jgi:hypothetical protein
MGSITPQTFRQFIEFQLDRPEHLERGYAFLKTVPRDQIRVLLKKHLSVLEKLVRTMPHSREIVSVIDRVNIRIMDNAGDVEWCANNKGRIVEVTEFTAAHVFRVQAYDARSRKTYGVKCKYFFKGIDDLYCLYLSVLLPHMPRVFSHDTFRNYITRANEFETATGERDFGANFEKILSNVSSVRIPWKDRNGFYFPSPCYRTHHVIENGTSYCITNNNVNKVVSAL